MKKLLFNQKLLLTAIVILLIPNLVSATPDLVILHINDCHGQLLHSGQDSEPIGGYPRIASLIQSVRDEYSEQTLLLHAGDVLSRADAITVSSKGHANIAVFDALNFDAWTPGNGDFYWGMQPLLALRDSANTPVIHANVRWKSTDLSKNNELPFEPYVIKEINGYTIGVLGLGVVRTDFFSARNLQLENAVEVAKTMIPQMRQQCDLVIVLSHLGLPDEQYLANNVNGIDVIVGGHSHSVLETAEVHLSPDAERTVLLVQAGDYGRYLGRLDLYLEHKSDGDLRIVRHDSKLIPVTEDITPDPAIEQLLAQFHDSAEEVVFSVDTKPGNIRVHVARAMRQKAGADVGIILETDITSELSPGPVTRGQVSSLHSYFNDILLVQIDGDALSTILALPQIVHSEKSGDVDWKPSPEDTYTVAVGSFAYWSTPELALFTAEETGTTITEVYVSMESREYILQE